jgi:GH15 family glucan-1,4-alpha-glucosidase
MNNMNASITDHILIGNCRTAALVSNSGSINWCCIPDFHSPGIFAALLDNEKGGFFVIQPVQHFRSSQSYIWDTNVAQLIFENDEGTVKLTDCFVAMEESQKQAELFPDHEILRIAEGVSGSVKLRFEYYPRIFYGKAAARLSNHKKLGIHFRYKENICVFQTSLSAFSMSDDREKLVGEFYLNKGERVVFSLSSSTQYPAIIPEINTTAINRLQNTISYWRTWISKCKYKGPFNDWVQRSALTLKLLTHAPSGAIIAAPTTSLPENPGGIRNWDYRFCWLRDASFTVRVLVNLGFYEEAHAYMSWILHATRLTQPELQVVYNVFGNAKLNEKNCEWLKGYKDSRPVRIGNNAYSQFQLDVYGEVLDAVHIYSGIVEGFDKGTKKFLIGLGKVICQHWSEPDDGIWEVRNSSRQHTHSKVMASVGLDRLISLCEKYNWSDAPIEQFKKTKQLIQSAVEEFGFKKELNSYVKDFESTEVDAALLTFPLVDYCNASAPGMIATVQRIKDQLVKHDFVYRHLNNDDGPMGGDNAFVIANFWLIENLAKMGKTEAAIDLFNQTIEAAPAHGLLSEEIDPRSKEWFGNYPQGFSHIGLINAALTINEELIKKQSS